MRAIGRSGRARRVLSANALIATKIDDIFVSRTGSEEKHPMGLAKYADDGFFAPRKIADAFRTTSEEVARTAGLGRDAVQRRERFRSPKTQRRLREMVEVINKVEPRFGSELI